MKNSNSKHSFTYNYYILFMLKYKNITFEYRASPQFEHSKWSIEKKHKRLNSHFINAIFKNNPNSKSQKLKNSLKRSKNQIPRSNLPKILKPSKYSKILLKPSKPSQNNSNANLSSFSKIESVPILPRMPKPEIGYFSFPKKSPKNLKLRKKKEIQESSISRWNNDGNPILWTLSND